MADFDHLLRQIEPFQLLIASGGSLGLDTRGAVDYSNAIPGDWWATPFLQLQFSNGPPAAGIAVDLYHLPGSSEGTERFAEGGDGTIGADVTPAPGFHVGSFYVVQPSTTVARDTSLKKIPLSAVGNRFVLHNISPNTIAAGWTFGLMLERQRQEQL